MANVLVNIEKGIEIGAEDALRWLSGANKALQAAPAVVAALATLIGAVEKPLSELAGAAANPLNIPLDVETVADLKAVWPQLEAFLKTLGVKL
ncbi:MAG: hypothetical protein WBV28_13720 [Terracidiphilus sp.]